MMWSMWYSGEYVVMVRDERARAAEMLKYVGGLSAWKYCGMSTLRCQDCVCVAG